MERSVMTIEEAICEYNTIKMLSPWDRERGPGYPRRWQESRYK